MQWAPKQKGFTIVELLIVVVVIAILAAITIVSYNGITNRANDATVQSDLSSMNKKIQLFYVDKDVYPANVTELASLGLDAANGAYAIAPNVAVNLAYCTSGSAKNFALFAMSKSGNRYMVKDGGSVVPDTTGTTWNSTTTPLTAQCAAVGLASALSHGYVDGSGPWRPWAGGN